jgi:serine/threonine-protein kinase TNNI3K
MVTSGEYVYFSTYQQALTHTKHFYSQTNILVNNQFNACIADFGLAQLVAVSNQQGNGSSVSHSGSVRWMAPELHDPKRFGFETFTRSFETDIYSFARVCLEVCPQ